MPVHPSRRLAIAALLLASLYPLAIASHYTPFINDDSYITLTYAKNLAAGQGFVYNHPPPVLGTTSPLFAVAVAALAAVLPQLSLPLIAVLFTALCWTAIAWLIMVFHDAWGMNEWQALIVGLVVMGSGSIDQLGMEFYLFSFLLVSCLSLYLSGHRFSAGIAAGLLFLTRGEGAILLVIMLIAALLEQLKRGARIDADLARKLLIPTLGFAIPVLLWSAYACQTFGAILPNTLAAKQAQGQTTHWSSMWRRFTAEWMPLWGKAFLFSPLPIVNVWWGTILVGVIGAFQRRPQWLAFAGWIILYVSGYIALGVSAYWWYQLPITFVLNLFFGLGIVVIVETMANRIKPVNLTLGLSGLLIILLVYMQARPNAMAISLYQGDQRGRSYTALSQWFREHTKSSDSIAYIEIGYLGFYTNNRIIDLAGLTAPDIVPHIAADDFAWGFWRYEPDYYVYLPDFDWALASIKSDPRFDLQYKSVATLRGPRASDFVIYERVAE